MNNYSNIFIVLSVLKSLLFFPLDITINDILNYCRVQINTLWFGKCDAVFIFHDAGFSHLPRKSWHQVRFFHKPKNSKILLLLPLKTVSICAHHFLWEAVILLATGASEFFWQKILFSNIIWVSFFSFSSVLCLFWPEFAYINIRCSWDFCFW